MDRTIDQMIEVASPGSYLLMATRKDTPWLLRIGDEDTIRVHGYGDPIYLRLPGLNDLVDALDAYRMDAGETGLEPFRADV